MRCVAPLVLVPLLGCARAQGGVAPSRELAEVAAAYAAKVVASAIFVSGRTIESVLAEELAPTRPIEAMIAPLLRFEVDREGGTVRCRLGVASATAVATRNLGCTLVRADADVAALRARGAAGLAALHTGPASEDWPLGDRVPPVPAATEAALRTILDAAFAEPEGGAPVRTRAVVVVHRGRLVAERYAPGFHAAMPLPGWSMTKTLTHALLGVRVLQGALPTAAPLPVPEWRDDDRHTTRLDDLLTMTAGLGWREDYDDPRSDVLRMLFASSDHAAVYAAMPRTAARGVSFVYSSGATNLLCRVLRTTFDDDRAYWAFPATALFAPLGMRSAVLETDPSGTFVGSSYGFATARDWARLALLYAGDGVFCGRRLLPPGWVAAATTAHPASGGRFGRHLWLNGDPDGDGPAAARWPELPPDLVHLDGHEGQYGVVIPSRELVVVRLGCTKSGGFDLRRLLQALLAALP